MSEKKDCKIVQDLLPNYIEELTNEETNKYIENHLNECSQCKVMLDNMQKELKSKVHNIDKREVDYIKKFRNKLKFLKLILLTIVLIYVIIIGRRSIIMTELAKKAKMYETKTNYYCKICIYEMNSIQITECRRLGKDFLIDTLYRKDKKDINITDYEKNNEGICLVEVDGKKRLIQRKPTCIQPHIYVAADNFWINLLEALSARVESTKCNGKECYIIMKSGFESYIDKETGIVIRVTGGSVTDDEGKRDTIVEYDYKFDVVKESDIVKPDISGCVET